MQSLAQSLPRLPGLSGTQTHASTPVWSGSTTKRIQFQPLSRKEALRLWYKARTFDRQSHQKGKHGGIIGRTALHVLEVLIFDFLNHASGRLDPSHATIARRANVSERTVRTALNRLRHLGILSWKRRCSKSWQDGRFSLEQETNAYALLPPSQWRGYTEPPLPSPPSPDTWGAPPRMLSSIETAAKEAQGDIRQAAKVLDLEPKGSLEAALASLGRTMAANGKA